LDRRRLKGADYAARKLKWETSMPASRSNRIALAGIAAACWLAACSTIPPEDGQQLSSIERHYERLCDSASRDIDNLMVHWENPRSSERMPASQVIGARQAMSIIAPVCENLGAVESLDPARKARVDAAFGALQSAGRNLPRLPAGN
jgi:hypothetical protein